MSLFHSLCLLYIISIFLLQFISLFHPHVKCLERYYFPLTITDTLDSGESSTLAQNIWAIEKIFETRDQELNCTFECILYPKLENSYFPLQKRKEMFFWKKIFSKILKLLFWCPQQFFLSFSQKKKFSLGAEYLPPPGKKQGIFLFSRGGSNSATSGIDCHPLHILFTSTNGEIQKELYEIIAFT